MALGVRIGTVGRHWRLKAILCWGSLLLCFWWALAAAEEPELFMQAMTFTTPDHATLSGSWITANLAAADVAEAVKRPAVILVHDFGLDRRDWGIFIPALVQHGVSVLAIDLRGHGQSIQAGTRQSGEYSFGTSSTFLSTGLLDIQGAVQWLKKRADVNAKAMSLIGVGAGGDVAYVAARQLGRRQIKSTVVISPSLAAVTEGEFLSDSPARAVLFCVTSGDANGSAMMAAESLSNFTDSPKKVVVYTSNAHGLSMFYKHPEIGPEILGWLGQ